MNPSDEINYQMLWDCPACGTQKLLGIDHRFCPACGSPQDANKRYFPPEGEEVEAEGHVYVGSDWTCAFCETPNSNKAENCPSCGASKDGSRPPQTVIDKKFEEESAAKIQSEEKEKKKFSVLKILLIAGLVGILVLVLLIKFLTKEENLTIDHHSWSTNVVVEELNVFNDSTWCDEMHRKVHPGFYSKLLFKKAKQKGTNRVADGEICKDKKVDRGDGTFKKERVCETKYKDVPIMDEYCTFTNAGWMVKHQLRNEADDMNPFFAEYEIQKKGNCIGCERIGKKEEFYFLNMQHDEKMKSCLVDKAKWEQFADQSKVKVKIGLIGGALQCDKMTLAK